MKALDFVKFVETEGISNAQYTILDIPKASPVFRTLRDDLKIRFIARCVDPSLLDHTCDNESSFLIYYPREYNEKTLVPHPWDYDACALLHLFNAPTGALEGEDLDCIPMVAIDEDGTLLWISKIY